MSTSTLEYVPPPPSLGTQPGPAYATTELGPLLLGIDQVIVENPEYGRAVVANARCCVGALSVEAFHKLDVS